MLRPIMFHFFTRLPQDQNYPRDTLFHFLGSLTQDQELCSITPLDRVFDGLSPVNNGNHCSEAKSDAQTGLFFFFDWTVHFLRSLT